MDEMTNNTSVETQETETEVGKTYTAEEVAKLIQSESDRRTNQALAKQKREYEKKLSLSSLDEQQRKEAEAQMKIEELQAQIAEFQVQKNKSELKSVLAARSLDVRFADIINITDDLEESQRNIDVLDTVFKECVRAEVEKRLAGSAPKTSGFGTSEVTKAEFQKMPITQQSALYKNNPELYKKLTSN